MKKNIHPKKIFHYIQALHYSAGTKWDYFPRKYSVSSKKEAIENYIYEVFKKYYRYELSESLFENNQYSLKVDYSHNDPWANICLIRYYVSN